MAAGGMIAAWMVEITEWFNWSGAGSFISLLTCGVFILPLCFIYSEMTSMLPYSGGANVWVSNAFGWTPGWFTCWMVLLLYIMAMPTVSYGISSMVGYLVPLESAASHTFMKVVAAVILFLWYFLTNKEIKFLARIQNVLFWSTLAVSIIASIIFIFSSEWSWETLTQKPAFFAMGFSGYMTAVAMLIMKFVGFDMIPALAEESNFPRKKLIWAFMGAIGLTILIYGLAIIGVGGIFNREEVMNMDIVDPRAADAIGMHWLGVLIVIMGAGTCITTLSSFWLSGSRTLYGAANQGQFSGIFSKLNKNGQPRNANIVIGIFALYFTVFAPESWINYIYSIYGFTAGVVYFLVTIAFWKLRKSQPDWKRPYKVKAPTLFFIISLIFTVYVVFTSVQQMVRDGVGPLVTLLIYLVIGLGLYFFTLRRQKADPEKWPRIVLNPENTPLDEDGGIIDPDPAVMRANAVAMAKAAQAQKDEPPTE